ncbi:tyrosine-type recombinase/integrase [Nocardia brasiliensis]|uniref:tyrosine-type recombinase/integrase n=1 Tax=Nocardia brasiliensis TaxID=37326 RepID=UPI0024537D9E|nr:site-specific integrase [Nocardia brasiliensis]
MSSVRVEARDDGSPYTQILFRVVNPQTGKKTFQTSESFDDHEAALAWKKILDTVGPEKAREILAAEKAARTAKIVTLRTFAPTYLKSLTGKEKGTTDKYLSYFENDIFPYMGDLPLIMLCEADAEKNSIVQDWVSDMEADGAAGKTIANKHGVLSACLKLAVRRRLMPWNPCEDSSLPPRTYEPTFLEPEEFDVLLDMTPKRWKPTVRFLVLSGCRWSEYTALRKRNVTRDREQEGDWLCRVARAWKYTGTSEQRLGDPKTKAGIRTINVPGEALTGFDLGKLKANDLIVSTEAGGRISSQLFHNKCWRPLVLKFEAEVGKKPRPHDLRHTCASWMINNGAELTDVQRHLGHEKIATTVDLYGHFDRRSGRRASTAVSKALVRTAVPAEAA